MSYQSSRLRSRERLYAAADAAVRKSSDPARRKCFVSYHADDADEVAAFIEKFGQVFIPRVIGVSESDPFVNSDDTDYVMDKVREKYLTDSTVTIVMVGKCTWARRFVDWEIYSSLRHDKNNRRSGVMAVTLPSVASKSDRKPPARVSDNLKGKDGDEGYARWWKYPTSANSLRNEIEIVYGYRTSRDHLIDNSRSRRTINSSCS